jgi:hypothetical protein
MKKQQKKQWCPRPVFPPVSFLLQDGEAATENHTAGQREPERCSALSKTLDATPY